MARTSKKNPIRSLPPRPLDLYNLNQTGLLQVLDRMSPKARVQYRNSIERGVNARAAALAAIEAAYARQHARVTLPNPGGPFPKDARVRIKADHWTGMGSGVGVVIGPGTYRTLVRFDDGHLSDLDNRALEVGTTAVSREEMLEARKNPSEPTPGKWHRRLGTYNYLSKNAQAFASVEPYGASWTAYAHARGTGNKLCQQTFNNLIDAKRFIEKCVDARRNPVSSPARSEFNAAFRAHRAWETRRIPFAEYDAATFGKGMPAHHAETARRAAKDWYAPPVTRLFWRRDSKGRLDAHLGNGAKVTVTHAPDWTRQQGFVAVVDILGIGGSPKYIDNKGRSDFGTVTGRTVVFPTEAAAKLAASRYLLRINRAIVGKPKLPGSF